MTSQKQIEANRRNAQKSTGPRSNAGKAFSRLNATKHGILSSAVVADGEEKELFDALLDSLVEQFDPKTPIEWLLVEKIAVLLWRERRLIASESAMMGERREQSGRESLVRLDYIDLTGESVLARHGLLSLNDQLLIGRYQTMINNQVFRTIEELRRHQEHRLKTIDAMNYANGDKSG